MTCDRCANDAPEWTRCPECGVHKDRPVKKKFRKRRHRPAKRGRNSGTTGSAKNK